MNCPHCGKVVRLVKDSNVGEAADPSEVGDLLAVIDMEALEPGFETDFIIQTRERWDQYGTRIKMSEKQMNALRKIAAK